METCYSFDSVRDILMYDLPSVPSQYVPATYDKARSSLAACSGSDGTRCNQTLPGSRRWMLGCLIPNPLTWPKNSSEELLGIALDVETGKKAPLSSCTATTVGIDATTRTPTTVPPSSRSTSASRTTTVLTEGLGNKRKGETGGVHSGRGQYARDTLPRDLVDRHPPDDEIEIVPSPKKRRLKENIISKKRNNDSIPRKSKTLEQNIISQRDSGGPVCPRVNNNSNSNSNISKYAPATTEDSQASKHTTKSSFFGQLSKKAEKVILVECPVCQEKMPERLINSHLNECLAGDMGDFGSDDVDDNDGSL